MALGFREKPKNRVSSYTCVATCILEKILKIVKGFLESSIKKEGI